MLKRLLNISLVFILLLALTGFTSTASICKCFKKEIKESCCQKQNHDEEDSKECCKVTLHHRLTSDLSVSNLETHVPEFDLTAIPLFTISSPDLIVSEKYSGEYDSSPMQVRDIPVLIQCFRN